jgi:hypothetical protein
MRVWERSKGGVAAATGMLAIHIGSHRFAKGKPMQYSTRCQAACSIAAPTTKRLQANRDLD